jgi:DNA-binding transcriptional regulator YdaS (Cro superfamily)
LLAKQEKLSTIGVVEAPKNPALERAIDAAGGITKLALALELSGHAVVHQWRSNRVPAEQCPLIERLTREAAAAKDDQSLVVTCEELRPDIAWGVLREPAV